MVDQTSDNTANIIGRDIQLSLSRIQQSIDLQTKALNSVLPTIQTVATSAGTSAGKYANVTISGVVYKIALLNP